MTLCSAANDVMFRDIEQVIRIRKVTHLSLTPTVAALVHPGNVPGVRFLVTAGEALTAKVHKDWAGKGLHQGEPLKSLLKFRVWSKFRMQVTVPARLQIFVLFGLILNSPIPFGILESLSKTPQHLLFQIVKSSP